MLNGGVEERIPTIVLSVVLEFSPPLFPKPLTLTVGHAVSPLTCLPGAVAGLITLPEVCGFSTASHRKHGKSLSRTKVPAHSKKAEGRGLDSKVPEHALVQSLNRPCMARSTCMGMACFSCHRCP